MLVDRFKNILRATINDQIENNPVLQNLFDDDDKKEWEKYYEEIKNDTYKYQNTQQQYQSQSEQQYSSQQNQQMSQEDEYYKALEVKRGDDFVL
ncbi:hypothetical protein, partial [Flammeovirga sp. SJP92]|uniref:hypothetical protein n=1 Tax=Flammeovirga sp. SJP92 TaxID=1775430 RepID=UPI001C12C8D8